ncbi:MAG: hypothetical protein IJD60_07595 [Clostridia bacterium]|nr:hypothetical protein [Clostridia bacterium]
MSTQSEITRIQTARNKLRSKAVALGIAQSTAKIDTLATAFDGIENRGAVSAQVQEGTTYTIPKGYHNGSGTVSGVAGGGNYELETGKVVTPTKSQQNITPASGKYGLAEVTVEAIPENYQDVSDVTAVEADVLTNKIFVKADGEVAAGTMKNNGAISRSIDGLTTTSATIPAGYTSGGTVSLTSDIENALAAI